MVPAKAKSAGLPQNRASDPAGSMPNIFLVIWPPLKRVYLASLKTGIFSLEGACAEQNSLCGGKCSLCGIQVCVLVATNWR